ncbi:protein SPEAR3 [Prosopis cineraria]|uniref:protein SPEAR3 n=1 Tax=Prosopis cineraria TaxID=364024 RepID=UPI00240ED9E1|nr:protein SPEAR3 [Prosopis cineraria]XP_054782316.1 protein SPEAR3 [Prosopis cineraria]
MGSGYFGELNLGSTERSSGSSALSSSSTRKGKKNNSDKPKQPQRGLGVAQLEKIRLHGQIDCGYPPPNPPPPLLHVPYPSNFNSQEDPRAQSAYSSIPSSSFSYSTSSSSNSPSYCFHPNIVQMGLPEYERSNIRYGSSQPTNTARWDLQNQSSAQPNVTRPFLNLYDHSHHIDGQNYRSGSFGSSSQNSESSDPQEPDLELRLSL